MKFPHCDNRILHKNGECEYCDRYPEWQELRETWKIAFTGHPPAPDETACPADIAVMWEERGDYNQWGGNRRKLNENLP